MNDVSFPDGEAGGPSPSYPDRNPTPAEISQTSPARKSGGRCVCPLMGTSRPIRPGHSVVAAPAPSELPSEVSALLVSSLRKISAHSELIPRCNRPQCRSPRGIPRTVPSSRVPARKALPPLSTRLDDPARTRTRRVLNKVPEATLYFWIIKVMATTVGETAADFLNTNLNLGLTGTTVVMAGLLAGVLVFQFRSRKYTPGLYWLAVVLISVVGTLVTDNLVDNFGLSLGTATAIFAAALALTFGIWQASEKTLSIHSIYSTKREAFYWTTILFTFALGTAAGDLVAESFSLGYWKSALLFAGLIALVTAAWRYANLNAILAFWVAYILTRPLGASLGDYLSQPADSGGLALGSVVTSAIFLATILGVVVYLTKTRRDEGSDTVTVSANGTA